MSQTHLPYKLWCGLVLLLLGPTMSQAIEDPAYEVVHKLGESVDIRRYTAYAKRQGPPTHRRCERRWARR